MIDISILIPSIRPTLLEGVYKSIEECFHGTWELIIVGPYDLPDSLKGKTNILYLSDYSSPIRARQIALMWAKGNYICYAADDVLFYPNALDISFKTLQGKDYKHLVVGKYLEGSEDNAFMKSDEYYRLKTHDFLKEPLFCSPDHYLLINTGLISRRLMLEIGGFDCQFEACAMACCDLSVRVQNYGANCYLQNEPIFHSTHLPGSEGDHTPIDRAQITHDQPLFRKIYFNQIGNSRQVIDLGNWKDAPDFWERRFGAKK